MQRGATRFSNACSFCRRVLGRLIAGSHLVLQLLDVCLQVPDGLRVVLLLGSRQLPLSCANFGHDCVARALLLLSCLQDLEGVALFADRHSLLTAASNAWRASGELLTG